MTILNIDKEIHKKLAIDLFNQTWDLIEKEGRTEADNDAMVNGAHASRYHWGIVGTPLQFARGEWQLSRVYSLVGRGEPAIYHAKKCLELCFTNNLGDFDLGFAYEAVARAYAVQEKNEQRDTYIVLAESAAEHVQNENDKSWLLKNIHTVKSLSLPKWE